MTAKELRIGNKVIHSESGYVYDILSIHFEGDVILYDLDPYTKEGVHVDCDIDEIQPLELTEEILLKCGFISCSIIDNHFNISGMCIWKCNDMFLCDKNGVHIKHFHQLQNLYFALTNEELEIKL